MDTLTQDEIFAAYRATVITAERAMALLSGYKKPEAAQVMERKLAPSVTKQKRKMQVCDNARRRWTAAEDAQILQNSTSGFTQRQIAKTLRRSQQAINHRLHIMRVRSKTKSSTGGGQAGMQL